MVEAWVLGGTVAIHAGVVARWAWGWKRSLIPTLSPTKQGPPAFTVVLPCRNEADRLPALLDSLKAMQAGLPFGVVVVNDHSEDDTLGLAQRHPVRAKVLDLPQGRAGKKAALLHAMDHVDSPWAITIDADVSLPETWADAWQRRLQGTPSTVAAVAATVVMTDGTGTRWDRLQTLDFASQMGWAASQMGLGQPASASGANFAVRPSCYPDTTGLGASGDDVLVLQALAQAGHEATWAHDQGLMARSPGPSNLHEWTNQRLRWAGKTKHYTPAAKATGCWMLWIAVAQVAAFSQGWQVAGAFWVAVSALHVAFTAPVAKQQGLVLKPFDWVCQALTQPLQAPWLLLAKAGALKLVGMPSTAKWKGRTCHA